MDSDYNNIHDCNAPYRFPERFPRQLSPSLLSEGYHSDSNVADNEQFNLVMLGSSDATDGSDVVSNHLHIT